MDKLNIIGIRIDNRGDHAASVQEVLTRYGTNISGCLHVINRMA